MKVGCKFTPLLLESVTSLNKAVLTIDPAPLARSRFAPRRSCHRLTQRSNERRVVRPSEATLLYGLPCAVPQLCALGLVCAERGHSGGEGSWPQWIEERGVLSVSQNFPKIWLVRRY